MEGREEGRDHCIVCQDQVCPHKNGVGLHKVDVSLSPSHGLVQGWFLVVPWLSGAIVTTWLPLVVRDGIQSPGHSWLPRRTVQWCYQFVST